jgi:estrogen-related receptor beta like 1
MSRLRVLHYIRDFCKPKGIRPFHNAYFALPSSNPSVQFDHFASLCEWVISIIRNGDRSLFSVDQYDDPNTIVNKLLLALRQLGFNLEFTPSKLSTASGGKTCLVLDFLTEEAMRSTQWQWQQPEYDDDQVLEEAEVDEQADLGEVEDDFEGTFGGQKDDEDEEEEKFFGAGAKKNDPNESGFLSQSMGKVIMESTIDPVIWQAELERVTPKLRSQMRRMGTAGSSSATEWRQHIEAALKHRTAIDSSSSSLSPLETIAQGLSEACNQISSKERAINHQLNEASSTFKTHKTELDSLRKTYQTSSETVQSFSETLEGLSDQLEEVKSKLDQRDLNVNSTSPLVNIKNSIKNLKKENNEMDLRIGIINHSLLSSKLREMQQQSMKKKRQGKHTKQSKRGKRYNDYDVDTSLQR